MAAMPVGRVGAVSVGLGLPPETAVADRAAQKSGERVLYLIAVLSQVHLLPFVSPFFCPAVRLCHGFELVGVI